MKDQIITKLIGAKLLNRITDTEVLTLLALNDELFASMLFEKVEDTICENYYIYNVRQIDLACLNLYIHTPMLPICWLITSCNLPDGFEFAYNLRLMMFIAIKLSEILSKEEINYFLGRLDIHAVETLIKGLEIISCNRKFFSKTPESSIILPTLEVDHLLREFILEQSDYSQSAKSTFLCQTDSLFKQWLSNLVKKDEVTVQLIKKKHKDLVIECSAKDFEDKYISYLDTKRDLRLAELAAVKAKAETEAVKSRQNFTKVKQDFKKQIKKKSSGYNLDAVWSF
jgi:hypothetical protein